MANVKNMTSGSPARLIVSFALPLMLGNLFQQFYTIADAAIVGQVLGVPGIAAIGATEWTVWMVLGIVSGFTQGFSIQMSQDFGARRYHELRKGIFNSAFLSILCAALLLILGVGLSGWILNLLNTPDSVRSDSAVYMRIIFLGIPASTAYNLFAAILRSLGDSKTPLYAMVIASVVNVSLDLLFVPVLGMGVMGAALATILAQLISGIFCFLKLRKLEVLHFEPQDKQLSGVLQRKLFCLGMPLAFQFTLIHVGGMILQYVVNGFGVIFIAGFTATNKLYGLLESAATSFGYSMTTYTGQNYGAGEIRRIRKGYWAALGIALIASLIVGIVMLLAGKPFLLMFISGDAQTVADTLAVAYKYLAIMSIFLPILYYLHVTRNFIQGLGNTVLPMISGLAEFLMRTAAALLLPRFISQNGIFYAEIIAWAGADVVLFFSFLYYYRRLLQKPTDQHI